MLITFSQFQSVKSIVNIYLNKTRPTSRGQLADFNVNRLSIYPISFIDIWNGRHLTLEMTPANKCANIYERTFYSMILTVHYPLIRTRRTSFVHM